MPFEELETITKANAPPTAVISYMPGGHSDSHKKNTDRKPTLRITIPTTICGVSKSETFTLLVGTGEQAGKLRIKGIAKSARETRFGCKPGQMKHAFRFNFGYVPKLGDDHFDGERRPVRRISDEEFEIDVPVSWFEAG